MGIRDNLLCAGAALLLMAAAAHAQVSVTIDQATGLVEISNDGAAAVNINGYDLRSVGDSAAANDGLLDSTGWSSLATSIGNGWLETNFASSELLLETNPNAALTLAAGATQSLGNAFTTNPATIAAAQTRAGFGVNAYRDVTFQYNDADNNSTVTAGAVTYTNPRFNDLVLNVDTATGTIELVNESAVAVEIEAFIINSASGSLDTSWNGLSDTVSNWESNIATANALAELSSLDVNGTGAPLNPLTINGGDTFDFGTAFNAGGTEDLSFSFLLTSDTAGAGSAGVIRYLAPSGLACDLDMDGDCDNDDIVMLYGGSPTPADIDTWLSQASDTVSETYVLGDADLDGDVDSVDLGQHLNNFNSTAGVGWFGGDFNADGNVDSMDLGLLLNNFNFTSASAAVVPEPGSLGLVLMACFAFLGVGRKQR